MNLSKRIVLVPILAIVATQLLLIRSVLSQNITNEYLNHKCYVKQGKYTPGSKFEEHRKTFIQSISIGDFRSGYDFRAVDFEHNSFISLILQCRGDSSGENCRACYATAIAGITRRCPRYKGGIIWYNQCLIEFSTVNTLDKIDYDNSFCTSNSKMVTGDKDSFHTKWFHLFGDLTTIATKEKTKKLYAAGESMFGMKKMYGMVQCTDDLSNKACKECLMHFTLRYEDCWRNKQGGRFDGRSCSFRFEFYPFLNTKAGPNKYLMG